MTLTAWIYEEMKQSFHLIVALAASILHGQTVHAQEAVPLSDELFTWSWVMTDFAGRTDAEIVTPPTFFVFDRADGDVGGDTPCGDSWNAKVKIDLPAVTFSEVEAFYSDECPASRETIAILNALEAVSAARTTAEGLELITQDGERLILLKAGG